MPPPRSTPSQRMQPSATRRQVPATRTWTAPRATKTQTRTAPQRTASASPPAAASVSPAGATTTGRQPGGTGYRAGPRRSTARRIPFIANGTGAWATAGSRAVSSSSPGQAVVRRRRDQDRRGQFRAAAPSNRDLAAISCTGPSAWIGKLPVPRGRGFLNFRSQIPARSLAVPDLLRGSCPSAGPAPAYPYFRTASPAQWQPSADSSR